jgi:hypothetical protein
LRYEKVHDYRIQHRLVDYRRDSVLAAHEASEYSAEDGYARLQDYTRHFFQPLEPPAFTKRWRDPLPVDGALPQEHHIDIQKPPDALAVSDEKGLLFVKASSSEQAAVERLVVQLNNP